MKAWAWMLGGLTLWGLHFLGVYLIASVADVVATADDPAWRMAGLAFSAGCVLTGAVLGLLALRRLRGAEGQVSRFRREVAALGFGVAVVAMIWQALPTIIGH
ncbi:MAG: hypothetical protein KAF64_16355 [Hydrogenophaga sp.]|uniref:hypothetical protein n=1 Tax=Hydrogenophaga sp. TaxID=1904254 RepID=UPI0025C269DC|nr:hypothetical protein [Hydrogenophaga sp.]MBU7574931.1 hypothetical protein [Hydrogenophaga sp.]